MSAYDDIFADFYSDNADLGVSQFDAANSLANYVGVDPIETEPTYEGQQNTMGMYGKIEPTVPYEVVPEKRMNIIQANPYTAKTSPPLSSNSFSDFLNDPFKENGLLDRGLGLVPGPFGWAWTLMRGANKANTWYSK